MEEKKKKCSESLSFTFNCCNGTISNNLITSYFYHIGWDLEPQFLICKLGLTRLLHSPNQVCVNMTEKKKSSVSLCFSQNCCNGTISGNPAVLHLKCMSTMSGLIALTDPRQIAQFLKIHFPAEARQSPSIILNTSLQAAHIHSQDLAENVQCLCPSYSMSGKLKWLQWTGS